MNFLSSTWSYWEDICISETETHQESFDLKSGESDYLHRKCFMDFLTSKTELTGQHSYCADEITAEFDFGRYTEILLYRSLLEQN